MSKSTNKKPKYKVGQFVRWYEAYAEGIMGKDAGFGIITDIRQNHQYEDYITYAVLRNKHGDVMSFEEGYIESKEDFKERMKEVDREKDANSSICS